MTPMMNFTRTLMRPVRRRLERLRNRHFVVLDVAVLLVTPLLALFLRVEKVTAIATYLPDVLRYTVAALVVRITIFWVCGFYRRYWRYATVDELMQIVAGSVVATLVTTALYLLAMAEGFLSSGNPRSLPILDGVMAMLFVGGFRLSSRLASRAFREPLRDDAKRVLIVGAGMAGQMLVRELLERPQSRLRPVGFVDDDPEKSRVRIHNLPVLGTHADLQQVIAGHRVAEVIIAMPNAPGIVVREVLRACEDAGVPARTVPSVTSILEGRFKVSQLRTVEIDDLLRRDPVQTDILAVQRSIRGKRVLITGGGGSIGSELCRQILQSEPAELVLLGHGENSVFDIQNELLAERSKLVRDRGIEPPAIRCVIADIRFADRIRSVMADTQPDVVFHAAAHKHVPLMELNPCEAISNNVIGTRNVLQAARSAGVKRFVLISTDKAVNPTNIMGASKRIAEYLVIQAARESGLAYVAVRFGNVLGSRGSVVPLFKKQIAMGGPITVSHPEMRRYFMTIPEAVELVLQASILGHGGEIFMLDMGQPVKIVDLARDLVELSGLELGRDIDIRFSGLRPGEKLFEELFNEGERYEETHHPKIMVAASASASVPGILDEAIRNVEKNIAQEDEQAIVGWLKQLVPEYTPDPRRWPQLESENVPEMVADAPKLQTSNLRGDIHAVIERT